MLDRITRAAGLRALAYRGDARHVAAQQAEVAALLGNAGEARAWRWVAKRLVGLSRRTAGPPPERRGEAGPVLATVAPSILQARARWCHAGIAALAGDPATESAWRGWPTPRQDRREVRATFPH